MPPPSEKTQEKWTPGYVAQQTAIWNDGIEGMDTYDTKLSARDEQVARLKAEELNNNEVRRQAFKTRVSELRRNTK